MHFRNRFLTIPLLLLLLISISDASGQILDSREFVITRYSMNEGLPQSSVNDIIQSRDRYLWLATYGGLVRFDGHSFTTFDRFNTPGMSSDRVLSLFESGDGSIWMGTENGFIRFEDTVAVPYFIRQQSQVYSPLMVEEDNRGIMWLTANGVIYRFSDSLFVPQPIYNDSLARERALANPYGVLLAHDQQIFKTLGDSVVQLWDLSDLLKYKIQTIREFPHGSGVLFVGTDGDGVCRIENGQFTLFSESAGLHSRYVKSLTIDRKDQFWVVTYNGISKWSGKEFTRFTSQLSDRPFQFTTLFEGLEGNYWIGTPDNGLIKLKPAPILTYDESDGLKTTNMLSMVRLKNGTILMATNCGGVYELKNGIIRQSPVNQFLPNLCVWSVFEDSKGQIWFGSRVLYRTQDPGKKGVVFNKEAGYGGDEVFAITETRDGNIWIGCLNGLYRWNGVSFMHFTTEAGLHYNDIRSLYQDQSDTLWIGTSAGLNYFVNGQIGRKSLTTNGHTEPYIRAIYKQPDGTLWIGTYGNGLIRLKNGQRTTITTREGLADNIVSHLVPDSTGNFWMGSNRGIFQIPIASLTDFSEGRKSQVFSISYGTGDGMRSAETNGGFQPSVVIASDGDLLFPTVHGVSRVRIRKINTHPDPPPVFIERVGSNGKSFSGNQLIELSHQSAHLDIRYTAVTFTDPTKVRFRYRLEGLQDNWIEATNSRNAVFPGLPPGDYQFRVIASNHLGIWNEEGAVVNISVLPPFWQTWWFRLILITGFLFIGPAVYWWRVSALEKERHQQEAFAQQLIDSQEAERRRIAADLHDGLGQQILVIKNRADLALKHRDLNAEISEQLEEIRKNAISSIQDVRQISHDLRPVHLEQFGLTDALNSLCDQIQSTSEIEWSYHIDSIDGLIPPEKEINFYRIIQEGTNNILKHSKAREASVMVRSLDGVLHAKLWDDGSGFRPEQRTGRGLGLSGMQERVKTLRGATMEIQSSPGNGTVIKIAIPLQYA